MFLDVLTDKAEEKKWLSEDRIWDTSYNVSDTFMDSYFKEWKYHNTDRSLLR